MMKNSLLDRHIISYPYCMDSFIKTNSIAPNPVFIYCRAGNIAWGGGLVLG